MRTWSTLKKLIWLYKGVMKAASWVWKTVSGSLLHITDALAGDVSALSVAINPVQSGSGDPAPDNVRPISGWTQAKVTRTGKNWFDFKSDYSDWVGGYLRANGQTTGSATYPAYERTSPYTPVCGGNKYTISFKYSDTLPSGGSSSINVCFYDKDKTLTGSRTNTAGPLFITVTAPADACYMRFSNRTYNLMADVQLELGESATAFEAYSGTTLTVDLDGTIYGGTLDVLTGVLTVTHRYFVADGVNIKTTGGWGAGGPKWLPAIVLSAADKAVAQTAGNILASYLKTSNDAQNEQNTIAFGNSGAIIPLHIGTMQGTDGTHGYNSAAEVHAAVNAYLAENNLQVWYKLDTPQTVQLTPAQLSTLAGENNVWADTGNITMTYMAQGG